jgi:hypothetical protein
MTGFAGEYEKGRGLWWTTGGTILLQLSGRGSRTCQWRVETSKQTAQ